MPPKQKLDKKEKMRNLADAKKMKTKAMTCKEKSVEKSGKKKSIEKPKKQSAKSPGNKKGVSEKPRQGHSLKKTQHTKTGTDGTKKLTGPKRKINKKPKEHLPPFGSKDTVVLLLMGASNNESEKKVFGNDMKAMRGILESEDYLGIKPENIITMTPPKKSETTFRGLFMKSMGTIKKKLKKKKSRFIFYYTGHFTDDRCFWIENGGTPDDYLKDEDFKQAIMRTSAEYIIFILDCCYSGKAEVGAKRVKKPSTIQSLPQLWNIDGKGIPSGEKGSGSQCTGIRKAVQLCSSHAGETSGYGTRYSCFTEAIKDVITHPSKDLKDLVTPGTCASVLQIFREVKKVLKISKEPLLNLTGQ